MRQRLLKGHLEFCFCKLSIWLVQVTMGKSVGAIVAGHGLPFAFCQDLKLNREPPDPSSGNLVPRSHPRVEIQLALILDIAQCCYLPLCSVK